MSTKRPTAPITTGNCHRNSGLIHGRPYRRTALFLAVLSVTVLTVGASPAAVHRPAAALAGDRYAADTQNARRDAAIRRRVVSALAALRSVDHRKLMVSVSRGIVTLRGKVPTIEDRARAEKAAGSVAGVRLVINQLEVVGPNIKKSAY